MSSSADIEIISVRKVSRGAKRLKMTMYCPKESFNRFGDDLAELILSYLPVKERFAFECLSKRIRGHIFAKNMELDLNMVVERLENMDLEGLQLLEPIDKILAKMPNLRDLELPKDFFNYCQLMAIITVRLKRLTSLTLNRLFHCQNCLTQYFDLFGPQLTTIDLQFDKDIETHQFLDSFARKLKNLKELGGGLESLDSIGPGFHTHLSPKLKKLEQIFFGNEDVNSFGVFAQNHKKLKILFVYCDFKLNNISFADLSRSLSLITGLKSLYLVIPFYEKNNLSLKPLKTLAKVETLKSLSLDFDDDIISIKTLDNIKELFYYYKTSLKRVELFAGINSITFYVMSSNWLRPLTQLTHLSLTSVGRRFFCDLYLNVPHLQSLKIQKLEVISVSIINELHRMKKLRYLEIKSVTQSVKVIMNGTSLPEDGAAISRIWKIFTKSHPKLEIRI